MSSIQITPCQIQPSIHISRNSQSSRLPAKFGFVQIRLINYARSFVKVTACVSKSSQYSLGVKYKQGAPICLFSGKGKSEDRNEDPPSESFEKDIGTSKSIEDVLREQIEKKEYAVEPYLGRGGKPPLGGGGGGGRGDRPGGSEDDFNETLQVIFATISFILLYLTTIHGEDMILLARDLIRFFCTGNRTFRLRKTMEWWEQRWPRSLKRIGRRRIEDDSSDEDGDEDDDEGED